MREDGKAYMIKLLYIYIYIILLILTTPAPWIQVNPVPSVGLNWQQQVAPSIHHLTADVLDRLRSLFILGLLQLLFQGELATGDATDLRDEFLLPEDVVLHQGVQGDLLRARVLPLDLLAMCLRLATLFRVLLDLSVVPIPGDLLRLEAHAPLHGGIPQLHNAGHVALNLIDLTPGASQTHVSMPQGSISKLHAPDVLCHLVALQTAPKHHFEPLQALSKAPGVS